MTGEEKSEVITTTNFVSQQLAKCATMQAATKKEKEKKRVLSSQLKEEGAESAAAQVRSAMNESVRAMMEEDMNDVQNIDSIYEEVKSLDVEE